MLLDLLPEEAIINRKGEDKVEILCPRDDESHSKRQEERGGSSAFWAAQDGGDGNGWMMRCETEGAAITGPRKARAVPIVI